MKILQGEEEEEDLGVGDIIEENWRCSVENPHHNLPQHYQSNQAPLSWQQTDLGGQWHLGTQADALISLPHVPHHDHHLVCHYPNAKSFTSC